MNKARLSPDNCMTIAYSLFFFLWFTLLTGCADNSSILGPYPNRGKASWYTARRTATGERFCSRDLTCAMRRRDFGRYYKVCSTQNNKCVVVRHNNFGPAKRMYNRGRIIDLSRAAFSQIADLKAGIIEVTLTEENSPATTAGPLR